MLLVLEGVGTQEEVVSVRDLVNRAPDVLQLMTFSANFLKISEGAAKSSHREGGTFELI